MKKFIYILIIILLFTGCNKSDINKEKGVENEKATIDKNIFVSYNGNLKLDGVDLVNQYNEKIILRGVSTHGLQWYSEYANEAMIKKLKEEWNSNVFRIAMYTEEGGYISDNSIKDKVMDIVSYAIKYDMYVIIDWHILSDGNPNIHLNEAIDFFTLISSKYKNTPNIIYEICNEPNGNVSWDNDIKPYSEKVISAIRKNSNNIIIVGTSTWSQDVDTASKNKLDFDNIMYACHFYTGTHTEFLRNKIIEARKNNIAVFISEMGLSDASGGGLVYLDEADKWFQFIKDNNLSWVNWSLSDKNESSALLIPGSPKDSLDDKYLSESGKYIKSQLLDNN